MPRYLFDQGIDFKRLWIRSGPIQRNEKRITYQFIRRYQGHTWPQYPFDAGVQLHQISNDLNQNLPSEEQTPAKSEKTMSKNISKPDVKKTNPYTKKYLKKDNLPKTSQKLPKIQPKISFDYFNQEQDDFNKALEAIIEKYQEPQDIQNILSNKQQSEEILTKISQAEFNYKYKNNNSKLDSTQISQKPAEKSPPKRKNSIKNQEKFLQEIKVDLDKNKLMYKSFDNAKLTSTLVNLDLEEISYCLAYALLSHIQNGDQERGKTALEFTPTLQQDTISSEDSFDLDESYKQVDDIIKQSFINKNNRYQEESKNDKQNFEDTFNEKDPVFRTSPKFETVKEYCKNIITTCKMEKETVIVSLIYIERLISTQTYFVTSFNWRLLIFIALVLASKIWDDESFENENFARAMGKYTTTEINHYECVYLRCIDYNLYIKCSDYAKYYYILRGYADKHNKSFPLKPLDLQTVIQLQNKSQKNGLIAKQSYINPMNKSFV